MLFPTGKVLIFFVALSLVLYEILFWFTLGRLVKIKIIKIFLLLLLILISLFLHHKEFLFEDIPTKT